MHDEHTLSSSSVCSAPGREAVLRAKCDLRTVNAAAVIKIKARTLEATMLARPNSSNQSEHAPSNR